MEAQSVLVVILAVALAVFLTLAIVLTVMLIRISKKVRHITDAAEKATDNFVSVSHVFKKTLQPAAITAALAQVVKKVTHHKPAKRTKK